MLILPLTILWLVWKNTTTHLPGAQWWTLPLTLCLLLDAVFLLLTLSGFIRQLIPNYPAWITVLSPLLICYLTALCARTRGVQYGAAVLAVPLVAFLVIGTLFLRASTRADRMWPILGDGLLSTARSALSGAGAVWGVPLLFGRGSTRKTAGWAALPWALCVICAVWFGFLNPWSAGDELPIAEKMMGLARHAHSVILYEMSGVLWMLLIPTALITCLSASGEWITQAFPRIPLWAALLPLGLLSAAAVLFVPEVLFSILQTLLPWRFVISLICGVGLLIHQWRKP